jgi:tetratricopeptide (TPR) repeat protein
VVLSGVGGIGKTALVHHLARTLRDQFPGGVLWTSLGPEARRAPAVTPGILRAWAQAHPQGRALDPADLTPDTLRGLLSHAPGRLLAVLDDAWFPGPVRELLKALPDGTACLVTTRAAQVAALGRPYTLPPLNADDGAALLLDRLDAAGLALVQDADPLRAIARQLGGHALALDLAARQIAAHGIAFAPRLVRRLHKYLDGATPFHALDLGQNAPRDDSLEATLYLSYAPLDPAAQAAFRALGALAPDTSFSERTAFALWGVEPDDDDAQENAEDTLATLVRAGLLAYEPDTGRFRQHLLLHAYARALALRASEHDPALGRYTWHVIRDIASQFDTLPMEQWDAVIGPDLPHIHHVGNALAGYLQAIVFGPMPLESLAQPDPPDDLLEIETGNRMAQALLERGEAFAEAVKTYIFRRRVGEEGLHWLHMGLASARLEEHRKIEGTLLSEVGIWHHQHGNPTVSLAYLNHSLSILQTIADRPGEGATLNRIARVYIRTGQQQAALDLYLQALEIRREEGDRAGEAQSLNNIAFAYDKLGQPQRALELYQQALAIRREVNDRFGEGVTLNNIAFMHNKLNQHAYALELFQQALAIHQEVGDRAGESRTLNNIARVYNHFGDYERALTFSEQAIAICREVSDKSVEASTLNNMGNSYRELGRHEQALDSYTRALCLAQQIHDRPKEATNCEHLALLLSALGRTADAVSHMERCVTIREEINHPDLEDACAFLEKLRRRLNDAPPSAPPAR